tara:strand:- start:7122 stop:7262 length:141 start_codon:yes stop_codon:yes gene_type:complete
MEKNLQFKNCLVYEPSLVSIGEKLAQSQIAMPGKASLCAFYSLLLL